MKIKDRLFGIGECALEREDWKDETKEAARDGADEVEERADAREERRNHRDR